MLAKGVGTVSRVTNLRTNERVCACYDLKQLPWMVQASSAFKRTKIGQETPSDKYHEKIIPKYIQVYDGIYFVYRFIIYIILVYTSI